MNVLGLKISSHDTGAALIYGGKVVAIAEERLNRVKHSFNMFPRLAIDYCLREAALSPKDVDLVVIDQVDTRKRMPMKEWFLKETGEAFSHCRIEVINHHDAHAASAFFCSPFAEAAVVVYDGSGEKFETHLGVAAVETETLYFGKDNRVFEIQKATHLQEEKRFPYTYGIGKLYQRISENYLNFGKYNEGKMMGLAPYGGDSMLRQFPRERWAKEVNGVIVCNARFTYPARSIAARLASVKNLGQLFGKVLGYARTKWNLAKRRVTKKLGDLYYRRIFVEPSFFSIVRLPRPARDAGVKLPDDYYASVAYMIQKVLEDVVLDWARKVQLITRSENICIAGGVGLNIDANKRYLDDVGFKRIFVQPGASDTGVPLGCALYGWHVILNQPRSWVMKSAALGKVYSENEILRALEKRKDEVAFEKHENVASAAAKLISEGNIIGWFYGGAEYGPRALGHRSILCDARVKEMTDVLNNKVKHREPWRPFAASVLRDEMPKWFELEEESPFMLLAAKVREDRRARVPAIVHVDGTCRIQTVTSAANGKYHDLVREFFRLTGVPMILNTSFNLGGDPIIETPADALQCFLATKMDWLVLEDYLVRKKSPA